ncbi:MAG: phage holin family protein [Aestuariivirga sp.]
MPKGSSERLQEPASRLAFPEFLTELGSSGVRWAEAEVALARAEAGVMFRSYLTGLLVALLGIATFIVALVILAQTCVAALAPYMGSQILAGLTIGLILLVIFGALLMLARYFLTRKTPPTGLIFHWLSGTARGKVQK